MSRQFWKPGNMLYPLPCAMVTAMRPGEKPNIITVAWTGTICTDPAMVYISLRPSRYSYDIIRETGEFVINLTTDRLVHAADLCGVKSGRDIDKFRECGLTPVPSGEVAPPAIAESPVAIECRVTQIIPLGSHDMFLANVLAVSVDDARMDPSGKFLLNDTGLIAYSHGDYLELGKQNGSFGFSVRKKHRSSRQTDTSEQKAQHRQNTDAQHRIVTYMLRCRDGSFYTGWTNDMKKRWAAHRSGKGGKYTRSHPPVAIAYLETFATKEEAMQREYAIKHLSRAQKEQLIADSRWRSQLPDDLIRLLGNH